jgi:hypothetical protein
MFTKSQTKAKLDAEICSALDQLSDLDKTSDEYGDLVDRIAKLHKLTTEDRSKFRVSPDTALIVAANLFGILRITRYEREDVINSKALGFIMKPR